MARHDGTSSCCRYHHADSFYCSLHCRALLPSATLPPSRLSSFLQRERGPGHNGLHDSCHCKLRLEAMICDVHEGSSFMPCLALPCSWMADGEFWHVSYFQHHLSCWKVGSASRPYGCSESPRLPGLEFCISAGVAGAQQPPSKN